MWEYNRPYAYIAHHGVKGQKWGVRRYQNPDGTLTLEGKKRLAARQVYKNALKTNEEINAIFNSMPLSERRNILYDDEEYITPETTQYLAKRFIKRVANEPVSFLDIWYNENRAGGISTGTKSGEEYRHKGYASELAKKAIRWLEESNLLSKDIDELRWSAYDTNIASIKTAKKSGFIDDPRYHDTGYWYGVYQRNKRS